jgi:hypothetical protein
MIATAVIVALLVVMVMPLVIVLPVISPAPCHVFTRNVPRNVLIPARSVLPHVPGRVFMLLVHVSCRVVPHVCAYHVMNDVRSCCDVVMHVLRSVVSPVLIH